MTVYGSTPAALTRDRMLTVTWKVVEIRLAQLSWPCVLKLEGLWPPPEGTIEEGGSPILSGMVTKDVCKSDDEYQRAISAA
jgi:hypothetical protein